MSLYRGELVAGPRESLLVQSAGRTICRT